MGTDSDWQVECSDEEIYSPSNTGTWRPKPEEVIVFYEKLSKDGESLELEWKCPGRRSPEPEKMEVEESEKITEDETEAEIPAAPTEFDFDDNGPSEVASDVTPRRTPANTRTPKTQKRVASMDKIMGDLMRHQKDEKTTPSRQSTKLKIRQIPMS